MAHHAGHKTYIRWFQFFQNRMATQAQMTRSNRNIENQMVELAKYTVQREENAAIE